MNHKEDLSSVFSSETPLVIRTYFEGGRNWEQMSTQFVAENDWGFKANLSMVNDIRFEGYTFEDLVECGIRESGHPIAFVADRATFHEEETTLLCIDLEQEPTSSFRVLCSELWTVENNLSTFNMDFNEFKDSCDENNIFRGFARIP